MERINSTDHIFTYKTEENITKKSEIQKLQLQKSTIEEALAKIKKEAAFSNVTNKIINNDVSNLELQLQQTNAHLIQQQSNLAMTNLRLTQSIMTHTTTTQQNMSLFSDHQEAIAKKKMLNSLLDDTITQLNAAHTFIQIATRDQPDRNHNKYQYNAIVTTKHRTSILGINAEPNYKQHVEPRFNQAQYEYDIEQAAQRLKKSQEALTFLNIKKYDLAQQLQSTEQEVLKTSKKFAEHNGLLDIVASEKSGCEQLYSLQQQELAETVSKSQNLSNILASNDTQQHRNNLKLYEAQKIQNRQIRLQEELRNIEQKLDVLKIQQDSVDVEESIGQSSHIQQNIEQNIVLKLEKITVTEELINIEEQHATARQQEITLNKQKQLITETTINAFQQENKTITQGIQSIDIDLANIFCSMTPAQQLAIQGVLSGEEYNLAINHLLRSADQQSDHIDILGSNNQQST